MFTTKYCHKGISCIPHSLKYKCYPKYFPMQWEKLTVMFAFPNSLSSPIQTRLPWKSMEMIHGKLSKIPQETSFSDMLANFYSHVRRENKLKE